MTLTHVSVRKRLLVIQIFSFDRRIEHQFNCNGDMVWFKGTVHKGTDTLHFRVVYDNEDGECCFPLHEDIANNEVRIL